jgi:8-oxo-dGTP pyrophosphatase MutT (NUDIX family)
MPLRKALLGALVDFCYRTAYRMAFPPAKVWWRIRGHNGASVLVWVGDQILVVRHSYKPGLQIPTGGLVPGEQHVLGAVRELAEETGVHLDPAALQLVMIRPTPWGLRYVYEVHLDQEPPVKVDMREIVYAGFRLPHEVFDPDQQVIGYLQSGMIRVA